MSGFIAMSRKALEHPLLQDGDRFRAWFWLVAHAAWRPTRTRIKGEMVELQRGELSFSQRFLAEKWGWSKSRVDRFMADLREEGMIATRQKNGATAGHNAGQGQAIVSICNYDKYQELQEPKRGNVEPRSGATAGQQRGKEEQGNQVLPLSNDNGPADFWAFAVGYLGERKRSLIGKWCSAYGQPATAQAIIEAQFNRVPDPVAYIERILRRTGSRTAPVVGI